MDEGRSGPVKTRETGRMETGRGVKVVNMKIKRES